MHCGRPVNFASAWLSCYFRTQHSNARKRYVVEAYKTRESLIFDEPGRWWHPL